MWAYSGKDVCNKGEGEGVRGGTEDEDKCMQWRRIRAKGRVRPNACCGEDASNKGEGGGGEEGEDKSNMCSGEGECEKDEEKDKGKGRQGKCVWWSRCTQGVERGRTNILGGERACKKDEGGREGVHEKDGGN